MGVDSAIPILLLKPPSFTGLLKDRLLRLNGGKGLNLVTMWRFYFDEGFIIYHFKNVFF